MTTSFYVSLLVCLVLFPIGVYFIQKHNLNYFKLSGRNPQEIEKWLKTRKWYNRFTDNIRESVAEEYAEYDSEEDDYKTTYTEEVIKEIDAKVDEIVSGSHDKTTISDAFCWMDTPEGTAYWGKKEYQFLMWYFGQYIDFHLWKTGV